MDTIELLAKFSDPETMQNLTVSNRLFAGLITTILGMGITFVSLVVLQVVMAIMAKFAAPASEPIASAASKQPAAVKEESGQAEEDEMMKDEELVAAITTALALQLKTSVSNIVIRNIEKVGDTSSAWHRAGISEHMNNSI